MRSFKRLLVLIIAIGLAAAVVFFTLENRAEVHLLFFGWQSPDLPMALYVMGAFVLGLIIGPLVSWWPHQRMRMRYNKQVKQLRACEQTVKSLQDAAAAQPEPERLAAELTKSS